MGDNKIKSNTIEDGLAHQLTLHSRVHFSALLLYSSMQLDHLPDTEILCLRFVSSRNCH